MDAIKRNVEDARARISEALTRAGRAPDAVTLVAVTKTFPAEVVQHVIDAGISDIGENRVQELVAKAEQITAPCRWHLVGPLQRNKARKVAGLAHLIHAVDGVAIAQTLDRIAAEDHLRVRFLLEVNTSGEASKFGVGPYETPRIADELLELRHLDWEGLMTIGPLDASESATRACFRRLSRLADDLRSRTDLAL